MSKIQVFNFNDEEIRTIICDGSPHFDAFNIAKVLGYWNESDAISRHCKKVVKHDIIDGKHIRPRSFISESDVYRLVMRSKMDRAEEFQDWVVDEVLPSIRGTGSYSVTAQLPDFSNPAEAARAWAKEYEGKEKALKQIEVDRPKVEFVDKYANGEGCSSLTVGLKNITSKPHKAIDMLRGLGYLYKSNGQNVAKQSYIDRGLFKQFPIEKNGKSLFQTKITAKGISYFAEKRVFDCLN